MKEEKKGKKVSPQSSVLSPLFSSLTLLFSSSEHFVAEENQEKKLVIFCHDS